MIPPKETVHDRMHSRIAEFGEMKLYAAHLGMTLPHLRRILNGTCDPTDAVFRDLGFEKRTYYGLG